MKCIECGAAMTERRDAFDYSTCGLPVMLLNVPVRRCRGCDEVEVSIPQIEDLHRLIADSVTRKKGRLAGAEIRFLRSWLGLSGRRFAKWSGVTPETVSRWEHDKAPISESHEHLLRLLAARQQLFADYDISEVFDADYDRTDASASHITARTADRGWKLDGAA